MTPLDDSAIIMLQQRAKTVLDKLVTSRGIYASTSEGWQGAYHAWFGRDSAITASLIFEAEALLGNAAFSAKAYEGLVRLSTWQGNADNAATGEERGKLPHEIRNRFTGTSKVQHAAGTNEKPWFVDSADGILKNWDSCDSTPLWVIAVARGQRLAGRKIDETTRAHVRRALEWCLRNLATFDGLAGFIGADEQAGRVYSGLHNQGWKDSAHIYQYADGSLAKQPIKDVLVNAEVWAALRHGAELFSDDPAFAQTLLNAAEELKMRFNNDRNGFAFAESSGATSFAEALDATNAQLRDFAADVGMCLWASDGDECIINDANLKGVVAQLLAPDMFNPNAGVRDYRLGSHFANGTGYHGDPNTYWPFVSALIVRGLDHFGFQSEARDVAIALLKGVAHFQTCIELFVETGDGFAPWHHPTLPQQSAADQAWTAAGMYYATSYLLRPKS